MRKDYRLVLESTGGDVMKKMLWQEPFYQQQASSDVTSYFRKSHLWAAGKTVLLMDFSRIITSFVTTKGLWTPGWKILHKG